MVYRIYSEKKEQFRNEAKGLLSEIKSFLGIKALEDIRIINRYDVEGISRELFEYACNTVFSEPQLDDISEKLEIGDAKVFASEFLPGQFDQRADSAAQCIQLISQGEKPLVRTAKVFLMYGNITDEDVNKIKGYVINAVESMEASLEEKETLKTEYETPDSVATLDGFIKLDAEGLAEFIASYGLAMDIDDIKFCQQYFIKEDRDPTITEIRMIDTYWSDHCRHTTFLTTITDAEFEARKADLLKQFAGAPDAPKSFDELLEKSPLGKEKTLQSVKTGMLIEKMIKGEIFNKDTKDYTADANKIIDNLKAENAIDQAVFTEKRCIKKSPMPFKHR